jgi:hypothetical protein
MCDNEDCACCKNGLESVLKWEKEMIDNHGWYSHYVIDDPMSPNGFNCHTHGVKEVFNHPDFQIVLPMHQGVCSGIFGRLVEKLKGGDSLEGTMDDVISMYSVRTIHAKEGDREVLRIIIPDKDGNLDNFEDDAFAAQLQ